MVGAPHNIIRHDDMPAGVFKLMWDDLEAGKPVCTYVLNRAGDGRDYWVFATVTAIEEGYVSVRTKPFDESTFAAVREVYGRVRALEREAAEQGASRREVAEKGAEALLAELDSLGFSSPVGLQHGVSAHRGRAADQEARACSASRGDGGGRRHNPRLR